MKHFIYIYHRITEWYIKKKEYDIPVVYGLAAISLLQLLNITTLILLGTFLLSIKLKVEKVWVFIAFFVIVALNYFLVAKSQRSTKLIEKWESEEKTNKKLKINRGYIIVIYTLLSFVICLFCAIQFSPKNW